jgi:predicted PurR-regulated permease PerM
MSVTQKEVRKLFVVILILLLIALTFIILRPILISIATGLLLAYVFIPFHKKVYHWTKQKRSLSAFIVCGIILALILLPLWFLVPLVIDQAFDLFTAVQSLDIAGFVENFFPTVNPEFQESITSAIISFIGKTTTTLINSLIDLLLDLPNLLLQVAVVLFVFYYTLKDRDKLSAYMSGLSPLTKEKGKIFVKNFKDITSSIVFGYILIGIIQGIATGVGLLIFGVPKALVLTLIAVFASMFPVFGPWLVWAPVAIYLFATGNFAMALGFTLYGALFVSSIDNFLRPYIVARKTGTSPVIVLVGMIGGLFVFGILGILFGPLILSYLILFLNAYKDKTLSGMFAPE